MSERTGEIERTTKETSVSLSIDLDGTGNSEVDTGIAFLDHMLGAFAKHGLFDLKVDAKGDLEVDEHHTIEDTAICLGRAVNAALGEARGIVRVGHSYVPLDEALARVVVDLSGRGYCVFRAEFDDLRVGAARDRHGAALFRDAGDRGPAQPARRGSSRPERSSPDRGVVQGLGSGLGHGEPDR